MPSTDGAAVRQTSAAVRQTSAAVRQTSAAVRQANAAACLMTLRDATGPLTVTKVGQLTGLSRPTVEAVLADLGELGAAGPVLLHDSPVRGPGRPARAFRFVGENALVLGIDTGPHTLTIIAADPSGRVLAESTRSLPGRLSRRQRIDALVGGVRLLLQSHDLADRPIKAAQLAVPGILDDHDRIRQSLVVPEWVDVDLRGILERRWDCPVGLENDIKLGALAEHHGGAGQGAQIMAYLQIGHRVSLALVFAGAIHQGSHRLAGELGTLRGMRWTTSSRRGQLTWQTGRTARSVFTRASAGHAEAAAEIDSFCAEIAPKIATIVLTIDPDLVVVGGGLSRSGAAFLDPLSRHVHQLLTTDQRPPLAASDLGSRGPVIGALGAAFTRFADHIAVIRGTTPPWPALVRTAADVGRITPPGQSRQARQTRRKKAS